MVILNTSTEKGALLQIGRQGEHGVTQVWFDLAYLIETYGEGTAALSYMRSGDTAPYLVTTTQENRILIWEVDETDTAYDGMGKCEVRWTVDDDLAKTVVYRTIVMKALTGTEPSDSDWYDKMVEYIDSRIADSQQYAEAAEASAEDAAGSAQDAQEAAGTAATDAAAAVRADLQQYADNAAQSAQTAQNAASTAATDAANAVRTELSGLAQQAAQSATNAANAADRAEDARDEVLAATVTVTPVITDGNLTFNAALNGGN